ncbi:5-hydroxytryptamine receptor 1A [Nematostella vectensis]|uniref:5-hydroxytryptamine receptor 1A n=1 Tax=Nematostella vectensis TaxID=45351 RepID=UPI00138FF102|nr:5-hydroxytryptamine receptor 1A [Nematostella vectensis]
MEFYMFGYKEYFLTSDLTIAIILILLSCYTVVGNTMVCIVYLKDPGRQLRTVSNHFVANLCVADILVGVIVEPLNASSNWNSEPRILFAFYITAILSCICSIVTIAAMMIDRYIAVSRPFEYKILVTSRRVRIALLLMWLFSLHFSLMPVLGWTTSFFQVYLYGLGILVPTAIMLLSYYGLLRILREKTKNLRNSSAREATHSKKSIAREKRISTTVFIMLLVFLIAWCPFVTVDFILVFCLECRDSSTIRIARDVTLVLGFSSSGVNPLLYAWRVPNFRKGFMLLFPCKRRNAVIPLKDLDSRSSAGFTIQDAIQSNESFGSRNSRKSKTDN